MSVQLRLLDKADKEIAGLPRSVKGAIYDFQRKFRRPDRQRAAVQAAQGWVPAVFGAGHRRLPRNSAPDHRTEYLLVAVKPRGEVYENLDRYA